MKHSRSKRETKKPKTKRKPDKRPHLGMHIPNRGWVSKEELKPEKEQELPDAYWYPGRDTNQPSAWSKQDAQSLIDMYAATVWGTNSTNHNEMSGNVTHFRNLYRKQKGRCIISEVPIYGGPGLVEHGIGIDLLIPKRGARRGNVRLVSAPLAATRFLHQSYPDYGKLKYYYESYPITWVIFKRLQQAIIKNRCFKYWPITFNWHSPTSKDKCEHSIELVLSLIDVRIKKVGLESYRGPVRRIKCAEVVLQDDRFVLKGHNDWTQSPRYISLADQQIDFIQYFEEYFFKQLIEVYKSTIRTNPRQGRR